MGYQINEYYCCVINKIVNDKQFTILWHVGNLKMFHFDSEIFSRVFSDIDTGYGKIVKITIMRGKIHKYLGMNINYSFSGKLIFSIINYIGKIIYDILEYMKEE